jgi:homoserine dehydrogenase
MSVRVPVIILGLGEVGRALLRQLARNGTKLIQQINVEIVVTGLVDLHHVLFDPAGLDNTALLAAVDGLDRGGSLLEQPGAQRKGTNREILEGMFLALAEPPVLIDATSAEGLAPDLLYGLDEGCSLALANARTLVGPWSVARRFFHDPGVRFEATVGAGLPVTRTLRDLLQTGDRASAIEGSLSGTLGYICSQLQLGVPFSGALAQAQELGYTEADPREDLNGQDSARKILVMGRLAGWPLEMRDVQVEQFCSPELARLPTQQFMAQVSQLDDNMARRVDVAREDGCVLRYVAEVDPGTARVGLRAVPRVSQLGVLQGTECLVTLFTTRYTVSPLTISGRGVGPELAGSALLSDTISLACSQASRSR